MTQSGTQTQSQNTTNQTQNQTNTQTGSQTQGTQSNDCNCECKKVIITEAKTNQNNDLIKKITGVIEKILPLKLTLELIDSITLPTNPFEYILASVFQLIPVLIMVITMVNVFERLASIG